MHKHTIAIALLSTLAWVPAQAAEPAPHTGLYAGGALGMSRYSLANPGVPVLKKDGTDLGMKFYGGWRFNENFGVEAGYARLGKFSERVRMNGSEVEQKGSGQVFYAAATGRIPLSDSFALNGRVGLAQGRVGGTNVLSASANPIGRERGLMVGAGVEYGLSRNLAITADYDHFGKLSRAAKGGLVTVGLRASF
jgi:opacity protein-like surface antigen